VELGGKEVVVTGASSGIGAAIARELAGRGARVTLVARRREGLEALAAELEGAGASVRVEPADLSKLDDVEALASRVLGASGAPDVLVNNAGSGRWLAIDETRPGEAAAMMTLPYLAAFELTRALAPAMIARGSGRIVCMTSLAAYTHFPGATGYAVARWAMRAFAGQLREDLRGTGVGVTLIAPSQVETPYYESNPGARERVPRAVVLFGGALPPALVARATAAAIERDRDEVIVPRRAHVVTKLTPRPLFDWLIRRTGWRRGTR
jgi:short-subunit dehydrogenase